MLKKATGRLRQSPCSPNARSRTPLVGRAQLGLSQPPLIKGIAAAALLGTRRVSARQGWAGEKAGLFEHSAESYSATGKS